MSTTGFAAAFGGAAEEAEEAEEDWESSAANTAAAIKNKEERVQSKRKPPGISTSWLGYQYSALRAGSVFRLKPECYDKKDCGGHAITTLLSSSMAEHPAVNRRVVGSNPT